MPGKQDSWAGLFLYIRSGDTPDSHAILSMEGASWRSHCQNLERTLKEAMRDLLRRQWQEFRLNLHPREYLYWLAQNLLLLFFKCATRVQLFGGGHYAPPARATILLSGHKRDWDPLLFAISLYYQRGWWRPDGRRMAFAGREDMFTPGFLAEIVGTWAWPRWVQRLLDVTALRPVIASLRAYPIARFPEVNLRHYLFEVQREQGNLPLSTILSEELLVQLDAWSKTLASRSPRFRARPSRDLRIRDVLPWSYREVLLQRLHRRFLLPAQWERYKALQREKIEQQIQALATPLERGDTLWLAPQGQTSPDGTIGHMRAIVSSLLTLAPAGTRLLPTNVTIDFMTSGRSRTCIAIGPPLEGLATLPRARVHKQVSAAITHQTVVTMSQLGSRFLWNRLQSGNPTFEQKEALSVVAQNVQFLAGQAALIERGLLDEKHLRQRLRAFLAYCVRRGLLRHISRSLYTINPAPFQVWPQNFAWLNPRYCVNELASLEAALVAQERSQVA